MSVRLVPTNPDHAEHELALGAWSNLLLAGPGLVIGFGHSITPGLLWESDYEDIGISPQHNDRYPFSDEEARAMALVAKGVASIWRGHQEVYRNTAYKAPFKGNVPPTEHHIVCMEAFAEWAGGSGGFKVH